jgi:hypothetical protein
MKNFIKKYWTHIFNISFLAYLIFIFVLFTNVMKNDSSDNPHTYFLLFLVIEVLMVFGVWAEIIYFIIKAAKNKELENKGLHIAGIYFLNMFYIPCFSLKHIHKDNKAKIKNIIYVLVTVCMFIAFCSSVLKFQGSLNSYKKYISSDKVVSVMIPEEYSDNVISSKYELYLMKDSSFTIGVNFYNNTAKSANEILIAQEEKLLKTRNDFKILEKETQNDEGKNIIIHTCRATKYDGGYHYFYISTITFDEKENYVVCVIGESLKENTEVTKNEFDNFVKNFKLNQK